MRSVCSSASFQAGSLSAAAARLRYRCRRSADGSASWSTSSPCNCSERSVRGTRLTEAGMRLYENAARGVEILHEAEQALASDQARLKGRLRLSLPPGFEPWWELLGVFQRRYPDIRVQVFTSERRIDLVEDGVDVALRVGAVAHEAMVARRLFAYRHVLVGSPRLLEREGGMETLDDLRRFPVGMWYRAAAARAPGCSVAKRSSRGSCWRPMTTRICVPAPWMPNWSPSYHRSWLPPRCVRGN